MANNAIQRIVVIGAGGQARETEWLVREINAQAPRYEFLGFVVGDLDRLGERDSCDRVLGDYSWLEQHSEVDCVAIGIGTPETRLKVAAEMTSRFPHLQFPALVHPSAIFDQETCRIGRGVLLCAGVVATVNVIVEDFAMANFGCTLGHEAHIGKASVVNPGANISGGVVLEEAVLVGTGAQILQYVHVGARAKIGAGAVVISDVAPGQTVVGVPAAQVKTAAGIAGKSR